MGWRWFFISRRGAERQRAQRNVFGVVTPHERVACDSYAGSGALPQTPHAEKSLVIFKREVSLLNIPPRLRISA